MAGIKVASLTAQLGLDDRPFQAQLKSVERVTARASSQMVGHFRGLSSAIASAVPGMSSLTSATAALRSASAGGAGVLAPLVAGLVGASGLAVASIQTARALGDLKDAADQLGVGVEKLQVLRFAALTAGVQDIDGALNQFTKRLGDARRGGAALEPTMRTLGLSMRDFAGTSTEQALEIVADGIARVGDRAVQAAASAAFFGKAGTKLVPILADGADGLQALEERARSLGVVLDAETIEQADRTADRFDELGQVAKVAGQQILTNLHPALEDLAASLVNAALEASNFLNQFSDTRTLSSLEEEIRGVTEQIEKLRLEAAREPGLLDWITGADQVDVEGFLRGAEERLSELVRQQALAAGRLRGEASGALDAFGDAGARASDAVEKLIDNVRDLKEQSAALAAGGEAARQLAEASQQAADMLAGLNDVERDVIAAQLGVADSATEALVPALARQIVEQERLKESLRAIAKGARDAATAQIELHDAHVKARDTFANQIADRIEATDRETMREIERRNQALAREAARQAEELARIQFEPIRNAIEGIQTALSDAFVDAFDDGFKSAKKFFNNLLTLGKRTIAELLSKNVMDALLGTGSAGGGGGLLGGLLGKALGAGRTQEEGESETQGLISKLGSQFSGLVDGFKDAFKVSGGALQPGGGGWDSLSGAEKVGQAAGIAAGVAAGIVGGFAVREKSSTNLLATQIPKIYNQIGSIVGSIAGTVAGVFAGGGAGLGAIGGLSGGLIGNYLARAQQNVGTGERWWNGIATIISGGLNLIFHRLIFGVERAKATVITTPTPREPGFFQHDYSVQSPFGILGLANVGSRKVPSEQTEAVVDFYKSFDQQIARLLTDHQLEVVKESLANATQSRSGVFLNNEFVNILKQRFQAMFGDLFDPIALEKYVRGLSDQLDDVEEVVGDLVDFVAQRAAIAQEIDDVLGENQISEFAKSLRDMNRHFTDLHNNAEVLGFSVAELARLEEARAVALEKLKEGFGTGIEDSILALLDPGALAARELERAQAERLKNAIDAEADLTRVAYLGQLERERLAREANKPITDLLTDLKTTLGSQLSPTDVLAAAESRFSDLIAVTQGGDRSRLDEVAEAARNLLSVSLQVFASTEQFFQRREFVLRQLENLVPGAAAQGLPGFASGGGFTVPGTGRDNVVPLFRVSGGERVSIATRGQSTQEAANFASLAAAIEDGNAEREAGNLAVVRELRGFSERLDRQQSQLSRVAALAARRARR